MGVHHPFAALLTSCVWPNSEDDPIVQQALRGADALAMSELMKLVYCVNNLRTAEAEISATAT